MEFVHDKGVPTRDLQGKLDTLAELKIQVAEINQDIADTKERIRAVHQKRVDPETSLNSEINRARHILEARRRRQRQLDAELSRLLVGACQGA